MEITFFGLFLLIGFIGSIILFYLESKKKNSDGKNIGDWVYQLLYFLFAIFSFSFLIFYSFLMIGQDFSLGFDHDKIVLDDMDLSNLVFVANETSDKSTEFFVFNFDNIQGDKTHTLMNSEFCFYYNNNDSSPNVVRVTNGVSEISDYVYLNNNTFGSECVNINNSYVKPNALLGVICLDCSGSNPLLFPKASISEEVKEIHVTKGDPLTYEIEFDLKAHVFWLETNNSPGFLVKEIFFKIYLLGLAAFILAFGFRWGFKYVSEDYHVHFS